MPANIGSFWGPDPQHLFFVAANPQQPNNDRGFMSFQPATFRKKDPRPATFRLKHPQNYRTPAAPPGEMNCRWNATAL